MSNLVTLDRRHAVKLLLVAGVASSVSGCGNSSEGAKTTPKKISRKALTVEELELLTALAGTIIPATDTPGAIEAGVPNTINELLQNWGADDLRLYWFNGLASIQSYFKKALSGKSFARLNNAQRLAALETYDTAVYSGEIDNPFYKNAKSTIAAAYYMSEVGADEELIYDPVPGDFKGCISFEDVGRAWAT